MWVVDDVRWGLRTKHASLFIESNSSTWCMVECDPPNFRHFVYLFACLPACLPACLSACLPCCCVPCPDRCRASSRTARLKRRRMRAPSPEPGARGGRGCQDTAAKGTT